MTVIIELHPNVGDNGRYNSTRRDGAGRETLISCWEIFTFGQSYLKEQHEALLL
jgi:hypothetical protein